MKPTLMELRIDSLSAMCMTKKNEQLEAEIQCCLWILFLFFSLCQRKVVDGWALNENLYSLKVLIK